MLPDHFSFSCFQCRARIEVLTAKKAGSGVERKDLRTKNTGCGVGAVSTKHRDQACNSNPPPTVWTWLLPLLLNTSQTQLVVFWFF